MKQVQKTIGRWVQRITAKHRDQAAAQPVRQTSELDAKTLRHVSGGVGEGNPDLPNKGW